MKGNAFLNPGRARKLLGEIACLGCSEELLSAIESTSLSSPDADSALLYFLRLVESSKERGFSEEMCETLKDNRAREVLALVFGASEYLSELIVSDPKIDSLAFGLSISGKVSLLLSCLRN